MNKNIDLYGLLEMLVGMKMNWGLREMDLKTLSCENLGSRHDLSIDVLNLFINKRQKALKSNLKNIY